MKLFKAILLCCMMPLLGYAADDVKTVQARMAERLPAINTMKKAQVVGEDNAGYLMVLKDQADKGLVKAENADRKLVYKAIAKQTDTTTKIVGRRRASQIAKRSATGVMIQNAKGKWAPKS